MARGEMEAQRGAVFAAISGHPLEILRTDRICCGIGEESRVTSRFWPDSNDGLAIYYNGGQTGLGGR